MGGQQLGVGAARERLNAVDVGDLARAETLFSDRPPGKLLLRYSAPPEAPPRCRWRRRTADFHG